MSDAPAEPATEMVDEATPAATEAVENDASAEAATEEEASAEVRILPTLLIYTLTLANTMQKLDLSLEELAKLGSKPKKGKGGGKGGKGKKKGPKAKAQVAVPPEVVTAAQGMEMSLDDFNSKKKELAQQTKKLGLKSAGIQKKQKKGAKGGTTGKGGRGKLTKGGRGDPGHAVGQAWEQNGKVFTPDGRTFSSNDVASFGNYMVKNFGASSVPKSVRQQIAPVRKPHPAEGLLDKPRRQSSPQRPKKSPQLKGIGKRQGGPRVKGRVTPKSAAGRKRGVIKASKVPGKQMSGLMARMNSAL